MAHLEDKVTIAQEEPIPNMECYYVWWPWLTSKRIARVCQHQLSLSTSLFTHPPCQLTFSLCRPTNMPACFMMFL